MTPNQVFRVDHMGVNADWMCPPPPSVYLPVLTSLPSRAEEPLWSWYGTVALRGCRLGLHPRGAAPPLADIPHSAPTAGLHLGKHARARPHTHTHAHALLFFFRFSPTSVTQQLWLFFSPSLYALSVHPEWC